jgi:hypothetical protein
MGGQFGLVGPTYSSQSPRADGQRCINLYPERDESGEGKYEWTLYGTPGLALAYDLGVGIIRCIFYSGTRCFAIAGNFLWELMADGTKVEIMQVAADANPAYISFGIQQLMVVSGSHGYCILPNGTVVVDPPGLVVPRQVDYCDGFFVAMRTDGKWQVTLDGTDWTDPGFISAASVFSESPISLICDHREVFLLSAKRGVFYQNTGNTFPFDVITGSMTEMGIGAIDSITRLDNSIFWLGQDERGGRMAWRAQGQTPVRISNHSTEHFWNKKKQYPTIADAIGWAYQEEGHTFWVVYFPTANTTWVFDAATNMWHERSFRDKTTGKDLAHLGRCHAYAFDRHLVGSRVDGKIYEMSLPVDNGNGGWNFVTDAGNLIHRIRIAPPISRENERDRYSRLTVEMEAGLGPQPPLQGGGIPTILTLADINGAVWDVTIKDDGQTFGFAPSPNIAKVYKLTEPGLTTTWQLGIDAQQRFTTTAIALDITQPVGIDMISVAGTMEFTLQVTAQGLIQTVATGEISRDPQLIVSWSDDGTRTWNVNPRILNCGQAGDFKRRAITSRMGASRNRNYKIECSDPIPWRILNATLKGDQFQPTERYVKQVGKIS